MFEETKDIEKCIYGYEDTLRIYGKTMNGFDIGETIYCIDGAEAQKYCKFKLAPSAKYIFRRSLKRGDLVPYHVSTNHDIFF